MRALVLCLVALMLPVMANAQGVRLKDLASFEGVRGNDLVGYGLVVGLDGSGDSLRNSPFTEETMSNILERLGVNVSGEQFRAKNVAAVIVTGQLKPFARAGSTIDVTVSAIGDASSLRGGTLIMTPLNAADGQIYAVAQGSIIAGGLVAEGDAAKAVQGVPTSGSVPSGAIVEREVDFDFGDQNSLVVALKVPDFSTASRIERAINVAVGNRMATMLDSGTVRLDLGVVSGRSPAQVIASIENLRVEPDTTAKVVVDQRSGTIVISENVRVSRVAVSKGNLTLTVQEQPIAIQPNPFSEGETVVVPRTTVGIGEKPGVSLAEVPRGTTLSDVITGLNALGITPNDLIDILKAIKAAGALHADFVVM